MTQEQYNTLKERIGKIHDYLNIEGKRMQLEEYKLRSADPDIYKPENEKNRDFIFGEIKELNKVLSIYDDMKSTFDDLSVLIEMEEDEEAEIAKYYMKAVRLADDMELMKILNQEGDNLGCVLSINAGAGGTEAQDWAGKLARMYIMWAKKRGYSVEVTHAESSGDNKEAGLKSCRMEIEGLNAYGFLKAENGVHRLVRVSPYNAQGKRMTSFASVFVIPLIDDTINVEIDESKLSWDTFRSSGAGGQNVNKVETGVRARYMYTDPDTGETEEIRVENTETRTQNGNKENARRILKSILYNKELQKRLAKQQEIEDSKLKIEWGAQIRSYVFDDSRVKDHRTGYETRNVDAVMDGDIDDFIKEYLLKN